MSVIEAVLRAIHIVRLHLRHCWKSLQLSASCHSESEELSSLGASKVVQTKGGSSLESRMRRAANLREIKAIGQSLAWQVNQCNYADLVAMQKWL